MISKLNERTVDIDFGTRSGTVTLTKLTEWARGDHHRVYFTLSHSVKNFPTKGYIDLSGNARVNPMQIVVRVGDLCIIIEDGFADSKTKKAEVIRAITELFTLPETTTEKENAMSAQSIFTSTTTSSGLTEENEQLFLESYCAAAPENYDAATDCENSPQPWCCPWFSMSRESWQEDLLDKLAQTGGDIREAAKLYALDDYKDLAELLAEAQENDDDAEEA